MSALATQTRLSPTYVLQFATNLANRLTREGYSYGNAGDGTRTVNCVDFTQLVVKDIFARAGYNLSRSDIDQIQLNLGGERYADHVNGFRGEGAAGLLVQKGLADYVRDKKDLRKGDIIQYHWQAADGSWRGHCGVISSVTGNGIELISSHSSPCKIGPTFVPWKEIQKFTAARVRSAESLVVGNVTLPPAAPEPLRTAGASRNDGALAALQSAGTNTKLIEGPGGTSPQLWKALTAVMGTEDISEYQGRSKFKSFGLKVDGKIGAITTSSILSDAIKILKDDSPGNKQKRDQVRAAFSAVYGQAKNDTDIIASIEQTMNSIVGADSFKNYMQAGLNLSSGSVEDKNEFAKLWGKKSWEEYEKTTSDEGVGLEGLKSYDVSQLSELQKRARKVAEDYLGRPMADREWDYLVRAIFAEASRHPKEEAYVAAVILNRAREEGGVVKALTRKNQFQAVTGTFADGNRPSSNFVNGPTSSALGGLLNGLIDHLPGAPKTFKNFTSANVSAYGAGTDIGYLEKLRRTQGSMQIGQTVFSGQATA
jgi:hypothetical protein